MAEPIGFLTHEARTSLPLVSSSSAAKDLMLALDNWFFLILLGEWRYCADTGGSDVAFFSFPFSEMRNWGS